MPTLNSNYRMATRREIYNQLIRVAMECYPEEEARQIAEMIVTSLGGISRNDLIIEPNQPLEIADLDSVCSDIRRWRPVQYIIGRAEFADMELHVREGVLIPRPETEELVEWIANEAPHGAKIMDVCTGSGCIALALRRAVANSEVWGLDISPEALAIARENGAIYAPDVRYIEGDALGDFDSNVACKSFDIVVSNPPYIPDSDKALMRKNVTDYEPDMALFVEDSDPLIFYRSIAHRALNILKPSGRIYFEIYESLADEMMEMMACEGYTDIVVKEDFRGKPRMLCAVVK